MELDKKIDITVVNNLSTRKPKPSYELANGQVLIFFTQILITDP